MIDIPMTYQSYINPAGHKIEFIDSNCPVPSYLINKRNVDATEYLNFIETELPFYYLKNKLLLETLFNQSYSKYYKLVDAYKETIGVSFDKAASIISKIDFSSPTVSFTTSNSIFFSFSVNHIYEINIELFLDYNENDEDDAEATINYFINNIQQPSYFGTLNEVASILSDVVATNEPYEYSSTIQLGMQAVDEDILPQ